MRLTTELLQQAQSYLNPLNDRELNLRDNDIQQLGNFPLSPRLKTLLLARNRISAIAPSLASSIPNLTVLALAANNLSELADLEPLAKFGRLTHLSLLDNPVTRKEHYRYWVIWKCPPVRFLDYKKVKDVEREQAKKLFGTESEPSPLAARIMGMKSKTFDVGEPLNGGASGSGQKEYTVRLSAAEKKAIEARIKSAKSLEEVARLERELREGPVPSGDAMEE